MDTSTFIVVWQESQTLDEVAEKTGLSKTSASTRAAGLRARGVELKLYPRGRQQVGNIEDYRELARKHSPAAR